MIVMDVKKAAARLTVNDLRQRGNCFLTSLIPLSNIWDTLSSSMSGSTFEYTIAFPGDSGSGQGRSHVPRPWGTCTTRTRPCELHDREGR